MKESRQILFLVPQIHSADGGIQASGKIAWQGICSGSEGQGAEPRGKGEEDGDERPEGRGQRSEVGDQRAEISNSALSNLQDSKPSSEKKSGFQSAYLFCADAADTASKLRAVLAAARWRRAVDVVLVWHIGLLKLLPFFRLPGAKVVLFLHGIEAWKRQEWLVRRALKRVNLFLTNSDYTWRRFVSCNPELVDASHWTIPLGSGSPEAAPSAKPHNPPAALMISRLAQSENYKGHREMIDAWPLVLERLPGAELWIAGDGDLRPELEALAKSLGVERSVCFWGRVSEAKKKELIGQSRCLAMPSRGEGFGLVYVEAMRMGRPCLVSDQDAGREVVNSPEAGLAVSPDNPDELAGAVCRLLSDGQEWQRWSSQARARYESRFTAVHFQQRLLSALVS